MDKLLEDLYLTYSPSGKEDDMINFIIKELGDSSKYGEVKIERDETKNIYVTKGKGDKTHGFYPCAVAHMDQVQTFGATHLFEVNDVVFGWNCTRNEQAGLGADDKNGIWCALKLLQKFSDIKVAFFVSEETGCNGSAKANSVFFEDVKFVLQADRKNASDIIFTANGDDIASKCFKEAIEKLYTNKGYKPTSGLSTDVWKLGKTHKIDVSACNISCGYHNPHTSTEYTVLTELNNCLELMIEIFNKVSFRCPHIVPAYQYAVSKTGSGVPLFRDYNDDWNDYGWPHSYGCGSSHALGTSYYGGTSLPKTTTKTAATTTTTSGQEYTKSFFEEYNDLVLEIAGNPDFDTMNIEEYYKLEHSKYPHLMARDFIVAQLDAVMTFPVGAECAN